jgi:hypothetical protein
MCCGRDLLAIVLLHLERRHVYFPYFPTTGKNDEYRKQEREEKPRKFNRKCVAHYAESGTCALTRQRELSYSQWQQTRGLICECL